MRKDIPIGAPGYVGGSLGAAALGLSTFMTQYEAYQRFIGQAPEPDEETQKRFAIGHRGEDMVSDLIEEFYHVRLRRSSLAYVDSEHPWLICHPDRVAYLPNGERVPVEIKMASSYSARKWGEEDTDQIPYQYLVQCYFYHKTNVPNSGYMWQFTFADNQLRRYIIRFDEELERKIFDRLIDVVENQWMKGIAPAPENVADAKAMWFGETDGEIAADEDIIKVLGRLRAVKEEQKALEKERDQLETQLIDFMQDYGTLVSPSDGSRLATYRMQKSTRFDSKAFREASRRNERLYQEFQKTTSSMILRTN